MTTPRLSRFVLALIAPHEDRAELIAGLEDEARELAARAGDRAARRWYRRQALRSALPLIRRRATLIGRNTLETGRMTDLKLDLVFALRRLRRRPALSLVVALTMALGIGAVTSVFSVSDAVLFRPIPLPDSSRIVRVYTTMRDGDDAGAAFASVNYLDLADVARSSRTLVAVAPYTTASYTWQSDAGPEPIAAVQVSEPYLDALGLTLQRGQWFAADDFRPGGELVAILTDAFWRRAFGARSDVVGSTVELDGRRARIAGVLSASTFLFPAAPEIWVPLKVAPDSYLNNRQSVSLGAVARVAPAFSLEDAAREVASIEAGLQADHPAQTGRRDLSLRRMSETLAAPVRPTLVLLIAAVAAVLLIAAANIADLLMTEAASRRHEFAIRSAMGAGSVRLTRQVLVETLTLMATGAALGLLTAPVMTSRLIDLYPGALPRTAEIAMNWRALGVALLATLLAGGCATLPLMRSSARARIESDLRAGGRGGSGRRTRRLASALIVVQVALTFVVVMAGVALLRTFVATSAQPLGFDPNDVLVFNVSPSGPQYDSVEATNQFFDDLFERVRRLSGVSAVGATQFLPFAPGMWGDNFARVGSADVAPNLPGTTVHFITPELPRALGLTVVAGRGFTAADAPGRPLVAMVNETVSRRYFDGRPVGRSIVWQKQTLEIVGVVSDKKHNSIVEPAPPELYLAWAQQRRGGGWVVVRSSRAAVLAPEIKAQLRALDPRVPISRVGTMSSRLSSVLSPQRFRATLAGALSASGLGLALLGLYGLLMHRVRQQSREIAIRLALGEASRAVRRRVVASSVKLALTGVLLGLVFTIWTGRLIQEFVATGERANDPVALAVVSALMLGVAMASAWLPARRASRVDPLAALRQD